MVVGAVSLLIAHTVSHTGLSQSFGVYPVLSMQAA